jgi:hypothetical protein
MAIRYTVLVLALAAGLAAQSNPSPGEDWVPLFNGKDLSGWQQIGNEKWTVDEGIIHGVAVTDAYGYLQTAKKYQDFHLGMRFRCQGSGNSGLFFHVDFTPGTPEVSQGLQFEIDCAVNRHTGGVYGHGRQWIVWPAPENETVVRQNDWNDLQVKVEGNRYVARLNGVLMVDFTDPKPRVSDGYIALQLHSGGDGNMLFKDLYIRDLSKR